MRAPLPSGENGCRRGAHEGIVFVNWQLAGFSQPPSLQEAELSLDPSYLDQFTELNHVLEALRSRNVEPALE